MKKSELKKLIREEFQKITEKKVKSRINVEKLIEDFKTFQTDYKKAVDNSRDKKAELDDKYATILEKIFKNYNGEILDVAVDAMIYDKVVTIEQLEELQQYLEKTHRWKANRVNAALRRMLDYGRRIIMKDIEIRKYKDVWHDKHRRKQSEGVNRMKKSELKKLIREEILKEEIDLRKAFYSLSDSIIGFSETIKGEQFTGDSTIVEMNTQLNGILDKILNHLNINYKGWD